MKKIATFLILLFAASSTLFAQIPPCEGIKTEVTSTISGTTVSFNVTTDGTIISQSWDFRDGSSSSDLNATHNYTKAGTWEPCVLIKFQIKGTNTYCTTKICKNITIQGSDPCAGFNPTADFTVDANGKATYKSTYNSSYTYEWDFGDNTSSSTSDGTHQYKPGSYRACVTINATIGGVKCTPKKLCKEFTVKGEEDPCKDFNPTIEYKIGENGVVTFWGSGNTTNTLSYTWSYGDGSSGTQNSHTYKPGTYKGSVLITDHKTGCKKYVHFDFTIKGTNSDPCKDFNPTFSYRLDGNVVVFVAQSGTNFTYKWIFSNGKSSTDRNVKMDFTKPGTHKACVTITDPNTGCSKKVCKEIIIKGRENEDPCKGFNPKVSFQTDGLHLKVDVDGGKGATMEWKWGDGSKGSKDRTVTHTYTKAGKYEVCVTVYDAKRKCKKRICFTVEVAGKTSDPCANFKPEFSFTVTGNSIVVEGANGTGVEYYWNWGDKKEGKGRVSDHTYNIAGKYVICMTAHDPKTGCKKQICKTIVIGGNRYILPDQGEKETIMVYPNPADTKISVVTFSDKEAKIYVKDVNGVEVMRYDATPNENKTIDMLITDLPKGTYYIYLDQDGKVETTKFVK